MLNRSLGAFFWEGARFSLDRPGQTLQFARTVRRQARAARLRAEWVRRGIPVPPVIIFSITLKASVDTESSTPNVDAG
jgi:hypothetical protein